MRSKIAEAAFWAGKRLTGVVLNFEGLMCMEEDFHRYFPMGLKVKFLQHLICFIESTCWKSLVLEKQTKLDLTESELSDLAVMLLLCFQILQTSLLYICLVSNCIDQLVFLLLDMPKWPKVVVVINHLVSYAHGKRTQTLGQKI